jgi:sugar/nucleoside kinase (ribokinase family)
MGEKTVVNYRTPHTQFLRYLPPDDLFQKSKSLYLGHMAHIALEHRVRLLQKARRYALVTYATLGEDELRKGASYIDDLIHHIDFLIINKTEFAAYVGCAEDEIQLNTDIYSTFPQLPLSKTLIITNGAQGAHAYSLHEQWYEPAHPAKHIIDLTGAGDGFCAGFIASYQRHRHISAALKVAAQYAASKLSHLGAN